ncbi:MAG: hypothetical protein PF447_08185 [Spirochaetaceae bacterium]|nr:hypothetical protein [Spirochaetaceae bacterium]
MIVMDTLKISILASYLCPNNDYNEGIFSRTPITRPDGRIGLKVAEPFLTRGLHSLVIFSDSFYHPGTLELEISAKILGKYYFWGISRETLHMVTQVILKMTGLYIQPEGFLEAMVHKVHLVNDCLTNHPQEILEALSMVSAINPKY